MYVWWNERLDVCGLKLFVKGSSSRDKSAARIACRIMQVVKRKTVHRQKQLVPAKGSDCVMSPSYLPEVQVSNREWLCLPVQPRFAHFGYCQNTSMFSTERKCGFCAFLVGTVRSHNGVSAALSSCKKGRDYALRLGIQEYRGSSAK